MRKLIKKKKNLPKLCTTFSVQLVGISVGLNYENSCFSSVLFKRLMPLSIFSTQTYLQNDLIYESDTIHNL